MDSQLAMGNHNLATTLGKSIKRITMELRAQPGKQTDFLNSLADIVIYGGAAGGGKSYGLLLEMLRHYRNPNFVATIFRRTSAQFTRAGGLWDESEKMYAQIPGAVPKVSDHTWSFPHPTDPKRTGAVIQFAHLEHEKDKLNYAGAQIPLIAFDEVTHFSESQFIFLMSRNRSADCGFRPYIRATTNPERDSWVRRWIDWWIGDNGLPIPERSGVLRYFIRIEGEMYWEDSNGVSSPEALLAEYGAAAGITMIEQIKSFTFIPSKLTDNKVLMDNDPAYLGNLAAMDRMSKQMLLDGNWDVKPESGMFFRREWVTEMEYPPARLTSVRYWDTAASEPTQEYPDPDWTVGLLMGRCQEGLYWILAMKRFRKKSAGVQKEIFDTATNDGTGIRVCVEEDPGGAGKSVGDTYMRMLSSFDSRRRKVTKDKLTRFLPFSAACENGQVRIIKGIWNEDLYRELENFVGDDTGHDDIVDTCSGAYNELDGKMGIMTTSMTIPLDGMGKSNMFDINIGL